MKHNFRIIIGMLLLAIPLCMNAQVRPVKPTNEPKKVTVEKSEKEKLEQEEKEKEKEKKRREKKDAKGGFEMPKISGFVQGMYIANLNQEGSLIDNTLRMRRVRLSVDGTLFNGLTYKIQGDFSRSPMLVDAYLKYKVADAFAIQLGQFKTPFSIESPINPVNLEIFDYGESVQKLVGYSDVCGVGSLGRDLGLMATGDLFPVKGEEGIKYHVVNYAIGVFNGNGANQLDNNNRKDLVGRLEVHPGLKALTLSGSYYYGKYTKDDNKNCTRNRWAAGAQYNDGNLVIRAEYIGGTTGFLADVIGEDGQVTDIIELPTKSEGYYAVAGYNFRLGKEGKQTLMPVLRYEHFDKNALSGTEWYTVGINYWPLKSLNFKFDYSLIMTGSDIDGHRMVGILSYKF